MRVWAPFTLLLGLVCLASTPSSAASLQVYPTVFELSASNAAATLTLQNTGSAPLNAQVRVYRWTQVNGKDETVPATDVVASPPMIAVPAGSDQIVRLVRTSKGAPASEQAYRIVVDELPGANDTKQGQINLLFKYSVPLFVTAQSGGRSSLTWALEKTGDKTFIVASNNGSRRARIGGLTLKAQGAKDFTVGKGLNGYVLPGSIMRWALPGSVAAGNQGLVAVTARSDEGPINATAQVQGANRR